MPVSTSTRGDVVTLTLSDTSTLNALSGDMLDELAAALDAIAAEHPSGALVLTGAGSAFSSGANLAEVRVGDDLGASLRALHHPILRRLLEFPLPTVAALNGVVAGGACGYALACDVAIGARTSSFVLPFMRIGLVPDLGLTWLLPRRIGQGRALAALLLGEAIPAATALEWGLIHALVEDGDLQEHALDLARRLARAPRGALLATRRAVYAGCSASLEESLVSEADLQTHAGLSRDFSELLQAFRRRP